jgi:cell filamentation protein
LRGEDFLRGLDRDVFTGRLAYYLGEVNALHPFREGNGRAKRALVSQLARDAGYVLTWQHLDPARNIEASAASLRSDPEPLRKMLDALVGSDTRRSTRCQSGVERAGTTKRCRPSRGS